LKTGLWLSAGAVLLVVCPFGAVGQDKSGKIDAAKLEGTWKYVSGVENGKKIEADRLKVQSLIIDKKNFTLKGEKADADFVMAYELDTKTTPVGIKFTITKGPIGVGSKSNGIIELNGDELKVCYNPMDGAAPKTFESKEGSNFHLFVLKRGK
jgi:uncharacterized protein (TIGR03067 family)